MCIGERPNHNDAVVLWAFTNHTVIQIWELFTGSCSRRHDICADMCAVHIGSYGIGMCQYGWWPRTIGEPDEILICYRKLRLHQPLHMYI